MTGRRPPKIQQLQHGLRRVLADNPSPMTYWGTNTFIVGQGAVAVIDPGPDDPRHLQAIMAALGPDDHISHIFVTHAHLDHSPLAALLANATGAWVHAFGGPAAGRSTIMHKLALSGLAGGGEGVDHAFVPNIMLQDGQVTGENTWQLTAHWTPGHFGNHLCFSWRDIVFSGDHVMAWASSLISPPDGDLTDFMTSLDKVAALGCTKFYPAHGPEISDPARRIAWLVQHRRGRSEEILRALAVAPADRAALTRRIYRDTSAELLPAAERNVFAHLIDLVQSGRVRAPATLAEGAIFHLVTDQV